MGVQDCHRLRYVRLTVLQSVTRPEAALRNTHLVCRCKLPLEHSTPPNASFPSCVPSLCRLHYSSSIAAILSLDPLIAMPVTASFVHSSSSSSGLLHSASVRHDSSPRVSPCPVPFQPPSSPFRAIVTKTTSQSARSSKAMLRNTHHMYCRTLPPLNASFPSCMSSPHRLSTLR